MTPEKFNLPAIESSVVQLGTIGHWSFVVRPVFEDDCFTQFANSLDELDRAFVDQLNDDENFHQIYRITLFLSDLEQAEQFINVLKGDMSTVGPRPLPEREIKKFAANSECFLRFLLRPGITGTAQVNSSRLLKPDEVLHFDVQYVCELSLIRDIKLIIQTLRFSDISY